MMQNKNLAPQVDNKTKLIENLDELVSILDKSYKNSLTHNLSLLSKEQLSVHIAYWLNKAKTNQLKQQPNDKYSHFFMLFSVYENILTLQDKIRQEFKKEFKINLPKSYDSFMFFEQKIAQKLQDKLSEKPTEEKEVNN